MVDIIIIMAVRGVVILCGSIELANWQSSLHWPGYARPQCRGPPGGHTSSSELRHGSDALGKLVAWSGWQDTALKAEHFWYVHDYNLCL